VYAFCSERLPGFFIPIDALDVVKGVIILKKKPGKRSEQKAYT
jgi:hypothetical protein